MSKVEIVGVYQEHKNCYLIELIIHDCRRVNISDFNQKVKVALLKSTVQVPYETKLLNEIGTEIVGDFLLDRDERLWQGKVRIAFFLHYLNLKKTFQTPYGRIMLPNISMKPDRLNFIKYTEPD